MARLGDIFELQMGKTPSRNNQEYWKNGTHDWVSVGDLSGYQKYVEGTKEQITDCAVKETGIKYVPANTVIMSFKLSLGKTAITRVPIYTNEAIMAFIPKGKYDVLPDYFYYLFSYKDWSKRAHRAVKGETLNKQLLEDTIVNLPPLDEQRKIAAVLDKVSRLIALRRRQAKMLDVLVRARFVEMFGGIDNNTKYPYKSVKDFAEVVSGGTPSRDVADYWKNGTISWVKTTELRNTIIYKTEECITENGLNNSSAKLVPKGTVLIAMYGQGKTRGMTGYLGIEATTNQACACILPSSYINQKFLWQFFILSYNKLRGMARGGNQPNLNLNMIKNYPVLCPPIEMQDQFAIFADKATKVKTAITNSIELLQTLKKALMQKYFWINRATD